MLEMPSCWWLPGGEDANKNAEELMRLASETETDEQDDWEIPFE